MTQQPLRHLAVIDLGSNTTRLIVMAYRPGVMFRLVDEIRERVRLAEGMGAHNVLRPAAIKRALTTMAMFRAFCRANRVRKILPVATSAVRDAGNREAFLERVRTRTALKFRVLDGQEEARYAVLGAANSLTFEDGYVVDIGGGSVQVAEVRNRRLARSASLPLGTLRMSEAFVHSDPIDTADYKALQAHFEEALAELDWFRADGDLRLIGLGGTIRNLAKIDRAARDYPIDLLHGYVLAAEDVREITARLRRLPVAKRARVPGLKSDRADVMLPGAMLVRQLLRHSGFEEITICGHGVREGLFFETFLAGRAEPLLDNVRRFSVFNLARRYETDLPHTVHVARLALQLFDQLCVPRGGRPAERELLWAASQLHDIGMRVDYRNHHLHSEYLLLNNGLDGYTHREIALLALLARYHRFGSVDAGRYAALLERDDEKRLGRLAAVLRLCEYLERGRRQVITSVRSEEHDGRVTLRAQASADGGADASVELWDARRNASELFEKAFKAKLVIE